MATITISYGGGTSAYCDCDVAAGSTYTPGEDSVTITLTCKTFYGIPEDGELPKLRYLRYGEEYGTEEFTRVDDKTFILTTNFSAYGTVTSWTCQIYSMASQLYCEITNQLVNCECSHSGEYEPGESLELSVTCLDTYEFSVVPYVFYTQGSKEYTLEFTKSSDTEYTLTLEASTGVSYAVIGEAVMKSIISDKYGLITAYRVSKDELIAIAGKRWIERTFTPTYYEGTAVLYVANDEYIDTAKYVVNIFKIFLDLTSTSQEKLYFGPYDMDMTCDVIGTDIQTVDFGSVSIVGKHQNSIDYENTDIEIYLPFIGFVTLNTSDFMDKEVHLYYQVNILNGDALAILKADDVTRYTHSCNVSMNIPYQLGGNESIHTTIEPNNNYVADMPPSIHVKSHKATNGDESLPYKTTKFYACFGDLSGYTEATEIDFVVLSTHITKTEIDEIIQLIEGGVFL